MKQHAACPPWQVFQLVRRSDLLLPAGSTQRVAAVARLDVTLLREPGISPLDSEIRSMVEAIPHHPQSPVHCESCACKGKRIEMVAQDALDASFLMPEDMQPESLRSYRCPACESVQVFQVD